MESASALTKTFGGLIVRGTGDQIALDVKVSELPIPQHTYAANWLHLSADDGGVNLLFGSVIPPISVASSLLAIAYSRELFSTSYERAREFHQELSKNKERVGGAPPVLKDAQSLLAGPPPKFLFERASFDVMSYCGSDAEIAFYYLSPNEFQVLKNAKKLRSGLVKPIVSVLLSTPLLLLFLDTAASLVDQTAPSGVESE